MKVCVARFRVRKTPRQCNLPATIRPVRSSRNNLELVQRVKTCICNHSAKFRVARRTHRGVTTMRGSESGLHRTQTCLKTDPKRLKADPTSLNGSGDANILSPYRAVGGGAVTLPLFYFSYTRLSCSSEQFDAVSRGPCAREEFSELSDASVERRRCARRHDGGSCLHPFQPVSRERWATSARRQGDACGDSPAVSRV